MKTPFITCSIHTNYPPLISPPIITAARPHPYAWRILGKWSVFYQWFWSVCSYTGRAETQVFVRWWGNKGGFPMPGLYIVITQYLDLSYRGILRQRPGTVPDYGICWALMWTHPFSSTHARIWAPGPCVYFFALPAMLQFQSVVWQGERDWLCTRLHSGHWRCEHSPILYRYSGTSAQAPSVHRPLGNQSFPWQESLKGTAMCGCESSTSNAFSLLFPTTTTTTTTTSTFIQSPRWNCPLVRYWKE